jgi:hypothetical protein
MCLRFVFLLITRLAAWLRPSRREGGVEDRGDLDPAPPARRPATAATTLHDCRLGGPGTLRNPARRDTESAVPGVAAAGHLWVPKTCATWADALGIAVGSVKRLGVGRAGLGSAGGGMIFGLWA